MPAPTVIVDNVNDWKTAFPALKVITVRDYLARDYKATEKTPKFINLARSYSYLSEGYYCSLLAEARGHKILPSVTTLADISEERVASLKKNSLNALVTKKISTDLTLLSEAKRFAMLVCFGRCGFEQFGDLSRKIFEAVPLPVMRVDFEFIKSWRIRRIKPVFVRALLDQERQNLFIEGLNWYVGKNWLRTKKYSSTGYDLAILHNKNEKLPPSNMEALRCFIKEGRKLGLNVDLIGKESYAKIAEYDALFIRETTNINHHTYHFAKKAQMEGMVVIDDPDSILRCTNKVYLAELLAKNKIPSPQTIILNKGNLDTQLEKLSYPVVLKVPDGSFSRGVFRAESREQAVKYVKDLLKTSDLILAQEYLYTAYDWRIGVLDGKPLYACKYYMSSNHWQIVKHETNGRAIHGGSETLAIEDVPEVVVKCALDAAGLIGKGLYGVDLKQSEDGKVYVIEVNDNPSMDTEVEDMVLGDELYRQIMQVFLQRIIQTKGKTRLV